MGLARWPDKTKCRVGSTAAHDPLEGAMPHIGMPQELPNRAHMTLQHRALAKEPLSLSHVRIV